MSASDAPMKSRRQKWMAILARATSKDLADVFTRHARPDHIILKPAETGTVMVEARAGGTGDRFNLGEATVTRCVVRLSSGTMGFAYALGNDRCKAEQAALIDAMLQDTEKSTDSSLDDTPLAAEVARLAERQRATRDLASRKAAATKVDFFTLVRGE